MPSDETGMHGKEKVYGSIARSGPQKAARATLGNRQYPPLTPAPGTYVFE